MTCSRFFYWLIYDLNNNQLFIRLQCFVILIQKTVFVDEL